MNRRKIAPAAPEQDRLSVRVDRRITWREEDGGGAQQPAHRLAIETLWFAVRPCARATEGGGDEESSCPANSEAFLAPTAAASRTSLVRIAAGASVRASLGVLTLPFMLTGDTRIEQPQCVIRAGIATPESLIRGTSTFTYNGSTLSGFSVTSAPNMSINQLAAAANYPNGQISYTTTSQLASVGAPVVATPLSGQPLHSTVTAAYPLSSAQAAAISAQFKQMPNPAKCR